jgi:carbon-monoxide dehydrogenase medium subunit
MKPPDFRYVRPGTIAEAVEVLSSEPGAKVLAGGQSLMPALNMRLLAPELLVDINQIDGLAEIIVGPDTVTFGALVRQRAAERSAEVGAACPILHQALELVAHKPIRTRGTIVGSLVHADPSAELPAVLMLLDGTVTVAGPSGERSVDAEDLFAGYFETSLEPDEIAVSAAFRRIAPDEGTAFIEVTRRHGDFALCAVGAVVSADSARVALAGVDERPRAFDVSSLLSGSDDDLDALASAIDPQPDIHASTDYRRHLARELTRRAVEQAQHQIRQEHFA